MNWKDRRRVWLWGGIAVAAFVLVVVIIRGANLGPQARPTGEEPRIRVEMPDGEVRTMPMEQYVAGVVAGEIDNEWPEQALAAQAILARTYALRVVRATGKISADFAKAQAFRPDQVNNNVRQAVEDTRGQVVTYRGQLIKAWFFSCAGGSTATAEEGGFAKEATPYIKVVKDDGPCSDRFGDKKTWNASFTQAEVRRAVREAAGADPGFINSIRIGRKGPSGRAMTLVVNGRTVPAPAFRLAVGSEKMRSTLLTSLTEGGRITMAGRGFGHGVGMPQFGALNMAKDGRQAEDIIGHYFEGVEIQRLWD